MPSTAPPTLTDASVQLQGLGASLRERRKALGISAKTTAEAAGMSRITLHRIESGEASVTMGAYANASAALGVRIGIAQGISSVRKSIEDKGRPGVSAPIRVADYPRLRALAWHVPGDTELLPQQALEVYERHWRHLDPAPWEAHERELLETLIEVHGKGHLLV